MYKHYVRETVRGPCCKNLSLVDKSMVYMCVCAELRCRTPSLKLLESVAAEGTEE